MGHYAQGKAFHQAALAAAQEAEDRFLTVVSWGRISLACIYGKSHPDALTSIQTARSLADKHSTPMILGWLAAIEAEIQAHLSQAELCLQALEHAECFDNQPACTLISQAATLATQLHLHKVIQRLVALREPLRPWKELASVKTLDAHLAFLSSQGNEQH
jgi:hypothetical protein